MPIIRSMLDTDLYKLTMMQAILRWYEGWNVTYNFIARGTTCIPSSMYAAVRREVDAMATLTISLEELDFLRENCPYLKQSYLDFLGGFVFDPAEVEINPHGPHFAITIRGPWYRTVLWEVPLMAIISELYFQREGHKKSVEPGYSGRAFEKGRSLAQAGCRFADFGSRRRFSRNVHDVVVGELVEGARESTSTGAMVGTSNVWLAMKHGIRPIGTHAHEWFMAIASQFGYVRANANALKAWQTEFMGDLGIALTDTFTTKNFFEQFTMDFAKCFDGVRHDSGDPIRFAEQTIAHYRSLRINPLHKTIVFSDGLNVAEAIRINEWCRDQIGCSFGIGTNFTNDVGAQPLNMVIKLATCNGQHVIKLSDVKGKHTGDADTIGAVKQLLRL